MAQLTQQDHQELKKYFSMFDKNGDGFITSDELTTVMRYLGQNPTSEEVAKMIKDMDPNGDNKIEYREFVLGMSKRGIKTEKEETEAIYEAFKILDRDGNGFITSDELRHTMTCLGERMTEEEANAMIDEADVNGDGKINYEEFSRVITRRK